MGGGKKPGVGLRGVGSGPSLSVASRSGAIRGKNGRTGSGGSTSPLPIRVGERKTAGRPFKSTRAWVST